MLSSFCSSSQLTRLFCCNRASNSPGVFVGRLSLRSAPCMRCVCGCSSNLSSVCRCVSPVSLRQVALTELKPLKGLRVGVFNKVSPFRACKGACVQCWHAGVLHAHAVMDGATLFLEEPLLQAELMVMQTSPLGTSASAATAGVVGWQARHVCESACACGVCAPVCLRSQWCYNCSPAVAEAMRTTLNKLLALGAQQVEVTLPELDLCQVRQLPLKLLSYMTVSFAIAVVNERPVLMPQSHVRMKQHDSRTAVVAAACKRALTSLALLCRRCGVCVCVLACVSLPRPCPVRRSGGSPRHLDKGD